MKSGIKFAVRIGLGAFLFVYPLKAADKPIDKATLQEAQGRLNSAVSDYMMSQLPNTVPADGVDRLAVVRESLAAGADPNEYRTNDYSALLTTPFGFALGMGSSGMYWDPMLKADPLLIKELIKGGADISGPLPNRGPPPLVVVASNPKVFRLLIDAGADPMRKFQHHMATVSSNQIVDYILEMSVLHWVAGYGAAENLGLLLEKHRKLEDKDSEGFTPLLRAVDTGNLPNIQLLLKAGASTFTTNAAGQSFEELAATNLLVGILRQCGMTNHFQDVLRKFPVQARSRVVGRWMAVDTKFEITFRSDGSGLRFDSFWKQYRAISWRTNGEAIECHSIAKGRPDLLVPHQYQFSMDRYRFEPVTDSLVHLGNAYEDDKAPAHLKRVP